MFQVLPPPIMRSANNWIYSIWYLSHQVAVTVWQIPDAVDTVVCAPDDEWWYHPKHVEQFPDKINCARFNLVEHILERCTDPWTLKTWEALSRRSGSGSSERTGTVMMMMMMMVMVNKQTSRIMRNKSTLPVCNCSHVMYWHVSYCQVTCWEQSMALSHDGGTRKVWRNSLTHGSSVSALFTSAHGCQSFHIKTVPCIAAPYQCIWTDRLSLFVCKSIFSSIQTFAVFWILYAFFWVIPRRLNSDAGKLPRRKYTTRVCLFNDALSTTLCM